MSHNNIDQDGRRSGDLTEDRLGGDVSVSNATPLEVLLGEYEATKIDPVRCPVCQDATIVELPADWQVRVDGGEYFDLVGCGNPFHYRELGPDPLTLNFSYDRHDGGILVAFIGAGCAGFVVGAVVTLLVALYSWGRS